MTSRLLSPGIAAALGAAMLFGASTPIAKLLLGNIDPWMLAALLYLGSGVGLTLFRQLLRHSWPRLRRDEWIWLAGAIVVGGVIAPVLLMTGLTRMPASGASLLLNAESVFTALLAWIVFKENADRRVVLGMVAIVAGAVVLVWPGELRFGESLPVLAVVGACFAWAVDNNLTRKLALLDATWVTSMKGLCAGIVNLVAALAFGARLPEPAAMAQALMLGFLAYGISLALFVLALRHLGTGRTGAYFSVAPFFGTVLAIPLLSESVDARLISASALMGFGVWLHVTERRRHLHRHATTVHAHEHEHDEHHRHAVHPELPPGASHTHEHTHLPMTHDHEHFPDAHHRHDH
ncbi:MAG: DMT family transporter [Burkholderiales bacterium]|nr:DMT family transporter [Burkholderiales bacterium]